MENTDVIYEYELIDIAFEPSYEMPEEDVAWKVGEDVSEDPSHTTSAFECDADGIPMGSSMEDIRKREALIADFLCKWRENNGEGRILNEALQDYIYVRNVTFAEAKEHSSKSYKSTCAVMMLNEVLKSARPVRRVATKVGDRNQGSFAYMLIMVYRHDQLGSIKLTVGVRPSGQRIQYGITALRPHEPIIKDEAKTKKKRRTHR